MIESGSNRRSEEPSQAQPPPTLPVMKAIGVGELARFLHGKSSLDEAVSRAQTATRHYIKRQLTWWRHQTPGWDEIGA